eukprot:1200524-Amphidinium_carterae.1
MCEAQSFFEAGIEVEDRKSKVLAAAQVAQLIATSGHANQHAYESPASAMMHNKIADLLRKYLEGGIDAKSPSTEALAVSEAFYSLAKSVSRRSCGQLMLSA